MMQFLIKIRAKKGGKRGEGKEKEYKKWKENREKRKTKENEGRGKTKGGKKLKKLKKLKKVAALSNLNQSPQYFVDEFLPVASFSQTHTSFIHTYISKYTYFNFFPNEQHTFPKSS